MRLSTFPLGAGHEMQDLVQGAFEPRKVRQ